MLKLTDWILNNKSMLIAAILLATILFGYFALRIPLNTDFVTYLSEDSPVVEEFNRVGELFSSNYVAMVIYKPGAEDDLFTEGNLRLLRELTKRYEQVAGVKSVLSLTNAPDVRETPFGISVGDLIPEGTGKNGAAKTNAAMAELRSYVTSRDLYRGVLLDRTNDATLLLLTFSPEADHMQLAGRVVASTRAAAGSLERFYFGGMPFVMYSMSNGIISNLSLLIPLILLFLVGVLYLGFRSVSGVLFPILVVAVSAVWAVGILSLLGVSLDILTGIMPVILIAMGSADGIHLMRRYNEERRSGADVTGAMRTTVAELGVPIILTSLTTMVGFASLVVSDFAIIKSFGLSVSLAIFLALFVTLFFLPPLAAVFIRGSLRRGNAPGAAGADVAGPIRAGGDGAGKSRAMAAVADFVFRRRKGVVLGALGLAALMVAGIPFIVVNVDWSLCLARGSKPYQAEMLLRERFGGSLPLQISVKGDVRDPAVLSAMQDVQSYAEAQLLIGNVRSIASLLSEMNHVLNGRYATPESEQGVANLWVLLEGEESLDQFVAPDRTEALVQGRVETMATADLRASSDSVREILARAPETLVVVDRRLVGPEAEESLRAIQGRRIADRIAWQLGAGPEQRQTIREIVAAERRLNGPARNRLLTEAAADYLTSDLSEVPIARRGRALEIAEALFGDPDRDSGASAAGRAAPVGGSNRVNRATPAGGAIPADGAAPASAQDLPSAQRLDKRLARVLPQASEEDLYWLADSLSFRLSEAIRGQIAEAALAGLEASPSPAGMFPLEPSTRKRVHGALWELSNNLVPVPAAELDGSRELFSPGVVREVPIEMTITGMVPVLNEMERQLTPTQIKSVAITLTVVLVLLMIIFRSARIGMVALVPTILTILTNFAVLGYFGIGLDSFTAVIASVVIGLGIDYAIHFISRFRRELRRSPDERRALRVTLQTTGVAIIINALSVGLGFEVLNLAAGQHLRVFGGLLGLSLVASALYTLVILPALLLTTRAAVMHGAATGQQTQIDTRRV